MKVGVLTGGGDCPGLNAVIRAIVRKGCFHYEDEFVGFLEGWRGLLEDKTVPLDLASVGGILPRGGTILRTSRTNPSKHPDGLDICVAGPQKCLAGPPGMSLVAVSDEAWKRIRANPAASIALYAFSDKACMRDTMSSDRSSATPIFDSGSRYFASKS